MIEPTQVLYEGNEANDIKPLNQLIVAHVDGHYICTHLDISVW